MTREEAIALLQSRVGKGISQNEFNGLKELIDEPKYHKVSEEGLPTDEGIYIAYFFGSEYPELCFYFKEKCKEILNWEGEGLYWFVDCWFTKVGCCKDIIAWQKVPYKKEIATD